MNAALCSRSLGKTELRREDQTRPLTHPLVAAVFGVDREPAPSLLGRTGRG